MKLSDAVKILTDAGVESPRHDAREIFMRLGGIPLQSLIVCDVELSDTEISDAIARRAKREPLQYIIGEVDFYREKYKVSPDCLIPREDTEILVDLAVKNIPEGKSFLDLCTGSGCIAVSTLKNTRGTHAVAVDLSESALSLARYNAEKNGVCDRVKFLCADALSDAVDGRFYAVLSNPPYVTEEAYKGLQPEIYFEPKMAFVGGETGLDFYHRILALYKDKIEEDGFFAFEIGYDQAEKITQIAKELGMNTEIIKDLSSNDRVAVIRRA